jgi:hypothetical protein
MALAETESDCGSAREGGMLCYNTGRGYAHLFIKREGGMFISASHQNRSYIIPQVLLCNAMTITLPHIQGPSVITHTHTHTHTQGILVSSGRAR